MQAALDQTRGPGKYDAGPWRALIEKRPKALDLKATRDDISPFLERPEDARLLTRENLQGLFRDAAASTGCSGSADSRMRIDRTWRGTGRGSSDEEEEARRDLRTPENGGGGLSV